MGTKTAITADSSETIGFLSGMTQVIHATYVYGRAPPFDPRKQLTGLARRLLKASNALHECRS